jgi:chromosome segregation ATPase
LNEVAENPMTIREYAEKMQVSRQSVNSKINRHSEELKNHVFIIKGRKVLDGFAQDFLKPTKDNALLISKNAELEKSLSITKFESRENKKLADSKEKKITNLTHELETKNKLFEEYVGIMKKMEQCIIEKNALIAEKDKRITELTEKVSNFEVFAERLNKLFAVFEDNANISIVQKVASGLFGKK